MANNKTWCPVCDGQGEIPYTEMIDGITEEIPVKCPKCNGKGIITIKSKISNQPCASLETVTYPRKIC